MSGPMKPTDQIVEVRKTPLGGGAAVGIIGLASVSFVMGVAVGALWFSRKAPAVLALQAPLTPPVVSAFPTNRLPAPVVVAPAQPASPAVDFAAIEAVKRSIPNLKSTSLEEGTSILRKAAIAEFERAARELKEEQTRLENAFANRPAGTEENADPKKLQQLQLEQMTKLKEIAASSKAQVDAFIQLKGTAQ